MGVKIILKNQGPWFVYMVHCSDGTLYTGVTTNLNRRLEEHNTGAAGAKYTRARRPVMLKWFERCESRSSASKREAEIKKLDREQKLRIIS